MRGYILVEGYGEVEAAHNLVSKISKDLMLDIYWGTPRRWVNLHQWGTERSGLRRGVEFIRGKSDAGALLILRDADDECPREIAPSISKMLATLGTPFPIAFVLLKPEYEVIFLPCMSEMSSVGYPSDCVWPFPSFEHSRDVKGWLSKQLPRGRSYKPTVNQLEMTRLVDMDMLRRSGLPCFGSLERAIRFLGEHFGLRGEVYP